MRFAFLEEDEEKIIFPKSRSEKTAAVFAFCALQRIVNIRASIQLEKMLIYFSCISALRSSQVPLLSESCSLLSEDQLSEDIYFRA